VSRNRSSKTLWGLLVRNLLQAGCPSCHPINSVKTPPDVTDGKHDISRLENILTDAGRLMDMTVPPVRIMLLLMLLLVVMTVMA